jgi:hypothetical protein
MMLTLLLSIMICILAMLMLWHAYIRACRNYIERYQPDTGIIAPTSGDVGVAKTPDIAGAHRKGSPGIRSTADHRRRSSKPRSFSLAIAIAALTRAA